MVNKQEYDAGLAKVLETIPPPLIAIATLEAVVSLKESGADNVTTLAPLINAATHLFVTFVEPHIYELVSNPATRDEPATRVAVYFAGLIAALIDSRGNAQKAADFLRKEVPDEWRTRLAKVADVVRSGALAAAAKRNTEGVANASC
jgi:hypothetical protein